MDSGTYSNQVTTILICDRARGKVPFVGNLKNEIMKFYDKLGFKGSFALISERNLLFLLYEKAFSSRIPGCKNG